MKTPQKTNNQDEDLICECGKLLKEHPVYDKLGYLCCPYFSLQTPPTLKDDEDKRLLNECGKPVYDYLEGFEDGKRVERNRFSEKIKRLRDEIAKLQYVRVYSKRRVYEKIDEIMGDFEK